MYVNRIKFGVAKVGTFKPLYIPQPQSGERPRRVTDIPPNDHPGSATTQTPPKLLKTRTFQQRIA